MFRGAERFFYAYPYGDYYIWGATAGILSNLCKVLREVDLLEPEAWKSKADAACPAHRSAAAVGALSRLLCVAVADPPATGWRSARDRLARGALALAARSGPCLRPRRLSLYLPHHRPSGGHKAGAAERGRRRRGAEPPGGLSDVGAS